MSKKIILVALFSIIALACGVFGVLFFIGTIKFNNNSGENSSSFITTMAETIPVEETTTIEKTTNSIYNGLGIHDTFSLKTESGVVEAVGYAYTKEIYDEENDDKQTYVYFKIVETKSSDFLKYLKQNLGNTFIDKEAIGIGCIHDGKVSYYNVNDDALLREGYDVYTFNQSDTKIILSSSKSKLIRLLMNKKKLSYGGGASLCYSHMTSIKIVN